MTLKDQLELAYWQKADLSAHTAKYPMYLAEWDWPDTAKSVLEIGTGPLSGFLPYISASRKVGFDPLYEGYRQAGLFIGCDGAEYRTSYFDQSPTDETFDAVLAADSLDHGDMGFHLLPKIEKLLNPGGRFFLHVHLRPPLLTNKIHDHRMLLTDLDEALKGTSFREVQRRVLPVDIDGWGCPTLIAVWEKP